MNGIKVRLIKTSNQLRTSQYTRAEEIEIYDSVLQDVYDNPRWYIDNLDYICIFRLSWGDYRYNRAILPKKE
jgi:hypothetical protein